MSKNTLYSGTAEFGRIMSVVGVIFGIIAGLIMIPLGIYFIVHKTKLTAHTKGTVAGTVQCDEKINNNQIVHDCSFKVNYKVGKNSYTIETSSNDSSRNYKEGDNITIYYDPSFPSDGSLFADNTHLTGIIVLIIGIIIPTISLIWWYFARKSKAVAAAGGIMAGLDLLSGGRSGGIL